MILVPVGLEKNIKSAVAKKSQLYHLPLARSPVFPAGKLKGKESSMLYSRFNRVLSRFKAEIQSLYRSVFQKNKKLDHADRRYSHILLVFKRLILL